MNTEWWRRRWRRRQRHWFPGSGGALGSPGPAPSNPALVLSQAAPLEFKPQPPPSFPALLPTETRRGHPGTRGEAALHQPETGQEELCLGAILTQGRTCALERATLGVKKWQPCFVCEGIRAEAKASAIFVEGKSPPGSVNLSGRWNSSVYQSVWCSKLLTPPQSRLSSFYPKGFCLKLKLR